MKRKTLIGFLMAMILWGASQVPAWAAMAIGVLPESAAGVTIVRKGETPANPLFLYEGDSQKHSKMIGNVRYVTVSHYSSDKNIFEKVGELITRDFHSDEPDKVTNEISVGLSMDISDGNGYCVSEQNEEEDT